ncbi:MAG: tRNA pseudouridine(55) synthase TruB [Bdellovibrionota bacterium]
MNKHLNKIPNAFNGLLAVNKPVGMVSKDVSRWLTKHLGKVKLGHVGTLDPMASGVLPILFGRATRLQDYLLDSPKVYSFVCKLGSETDTMDAEGSVVRQSPWEQVSIEDLSQAALSFLGNIEQTPPVYSAVKYKGKPLYQYAREGREDLVVLENLKRDVYVSTIDLLDYDRQSGLLTARVCCSKGTYVRVLARDIAEKAGTCGHVVKLTREKSSGIQISNTYGLEEIEEKVDDFASILVPMEDIDIGIPRCEIKEESLEKKLLNGQTVRLEKAHFKCWTSVDAAVSNNNHDFSSSDGVLKTIHEVVLISGKSKAFGIGSAEIKSDGISIKMKRGLL